MKLAVRITVLLITCCVLALAQTPTISGVVSQANFTRPVSPGMPVLVNGTNLAPAGWLDCPGPKVPLTCGSVSVTVNGRAVPVRSVSPGQVVTYIPVDQVAGQASVVLKNHLGAFSAAFTATVDLFAPGIQQMSDPSGSLLGFFVDSSQRAISRSNPATPGQELTIQALGLGPTAPVIPTGEMGSAPVTTLPTVWVGNRSYPASANLGCGVICDPGNYLVRFLLAPDIPSGDQSVTLEVAGRRSLPAILVVGPGSSGPAVGYLQSVLDARVRTMSPGMTANIVGAGFMAGFGGVGQCSIDPSFWPTKCQGVAVTINGRPAAIQTIASNFITIQIPFELTPGSATLVVERTVDTLTRKSAPFSFTLDALSPTLPVALPSSYAGIVIDSSGGVATATNPLLPGDSISIYAAGLGQTNPPMVTGFGLIQPARTVLTPTVTIGGKALEGVVAEVLPSSIGMYRVSAKVPAGLGAGDLPIVLEIGGKKSQDGMLVPVANQPVIGAVTNSASNTRDIVSGSWVSIYGRALSSSRREWNADDIIADALPTALDGVEVTINNAKAVVAYVSPMQLNVLAPDNLPPGVVEVNVKNAFGTQKSTANVKPYAPGLFLLAAPPGIHVLALHADWSYVALPGQLPPTVNAAPAQPGETIVLYGTGFGPTNPAVPYYKRFSGSAPLSSAAPVRVQIGPAQAQVVYAGMIANGLYQINVVVPELPGGDHEVIVSMGAESSVRGRYLPVRR